MNRPYIIWKRERLLVHGKTADHLIYDMPNPEGLAIDALAASGDCFEMLASSLDQISRTLPDDAIQQPELEQVIRTLLYLQRHYKIEKKHPR